MKNKKLIIIIAAIVAVLLVAFLCFGVSKPLKVENTMCYIGEATMPKFSGDGLDANKIDSIKYEFEKSVVTVDENYMLVATGHEDPFKCTMTVKSGMKRWKGEFYIHTSYKEIDVANGDMIVGENNGSCPLKVSNPEIGQKCYIYLRNNGGGNDFAFIVLGESNAEKKVPTGNYTLYVAYGYVTQGWYGPKYLFGKDGNSYYKRAETLDFTSSATQTSGYNMTVYDQEGGQVSLERIKYSDFPGVG